MDPPVAVGFVAVDYGRRRRTEVRRPHEEDRVLGGALAEGRELRVWHYLHPNGLALVAQHTLDIVGDQHSQVSLLVSVDTEKGQLVTE